MLLTSRSVLSCAWPEGYDGRYYWEHGTWIDRADFTSDAQMGLALINDFKLLYTEDVRIHSTRFYNPSTMGIYFQQTYGVIQLGALDPQPNYNLLICARWRMWGDDGSYTYHLHRQPVGEDYLMGGVWSDEGYIQQQTRMNTYIAQGIYRTSTGSLITLGSVDQLPTKWQLRHGTKRRKSRFWL